MMSAWLENPSLRASAPALSPVTTESLDPGNVLGSFGLGQGGTAALVRFTPEEARAESLHRWLLEEALPAVPHVPGFGSAHLLQGARAAAMTNEQRIRGADSGLDCALILTGYDDSAVAQYAKKLAEDGELRDRGGGELSCATYRLGYSVG